MHTHLYVCVPVTLRSTTVPLYVFFMNIFNIKSSPQWVSVCWLLISIGVCLSVCVSICLFVCLSVCVFIVLSKHTRLLALSLIICRYFVCVFEGFCRCVGVCIYICVSVHPCNSSVLLLFFCLLSCSFHGNSPVSQPVI